MTYVFDIDGTICGKLCELDGDDYLNAEPLQDRIKKANQLYQDGHTIIYQTARGMGRHNNNPILAIQDFYDLTKKQLNQIGIEQYEISNYSKPLYESRHNLLYWNSDSYLGIGPGAHS